MGAREIPTFCRVCEPACGLIAEVTDGRLTKLRPDREHPISQGFACNKGIAGLDIHHDPDRLNHPLRRKPNGEFERIDWDTAIGEIASRLRGIFETHGPDAIARYIGNPSAFNTLAGPAAGGFFAQLGTRRSFGSGTQDCANKFAGSEAVFGSSTMHPIPDLEHTDYLLILGENPRVSHMSFLAIADPIKVLRAARDRGARIRFINPRRVESSGELGDVVQIRPDTDLYLLAALLCEIDRTTGFDADVVREHGKRVDELRTFVRRYPPERVAPIVGVSVAEIRQLAREFAEAPSASAHMSTGVNMGRQGTLAYWLLHMLVFVTGNLDRRGGNMLSVGFYPSAKAGRREYEDGFTTGPAGRMRKGTLPGNLFAETIRDPDAPVRALFVISGNPVLSMGGEAALREAFGSLELLVSLDIYRNATGELAHYLLPCTDMFERADVNITGLGLQHRPYIQYTDAVVEPQHERREEWWILARLSQELGLKSALDAGDQVAGEDGAIRAGLWGRIDHMLGSRGLSLDEVRATDRGHVFAPAEPGEFYTRQLQTADHRVDCCPPGFADALDRAEAICCELLAEPPDTLKLITLRDAWMHNSWYQNVPVLKRGGRDRNFLYMHPDDAAARGFGDGERVRVSNDWGKLEVEVALADDLRPGVVAMVHGWGNARSPGMRVAQAHPGVNCNVLLPTGPDSFEALSNQSHMTGIPVQVEATSGA